MRTVGGTVAGVAELVLDLDLHVQVSGCGGLKQQTGVWSAKRSGRGIHHAQKEIAKAWKEEATKLIQ